MDLSKLPHRSVPAGPPGDQQSDAAPVAPRSVLAVESATTARPPFPLTDVFVDLAIGICLLLFYPRFLQWLFARLFHTPFAEFTDSAGTVVPYQTLPEFWSDLGPTLFGIVLLADAVVLLSRQRALIMVGLCLTMAAVLFNLGWLLFSYSRFGLAPVSLVAVFVGAYVAAQQWRLVRPAVR